MTRWFDATRARPIEVFELSGTTTVLAWDRKLIRTPHAELLVQYSEDETDIEAIELRLDLDLETVQALAAHPGIFPFGPQLLADYDPRVPLPLIFVAKPELVDRIRGEYAQSMPVHAMAHVLGDNDFPALFDLEGYTFRDLANVAPSWSPGPT